MKNELSRREFLAASAAVGVAGATLPRPGQCRAAEWKTELKKALIGKPTEPTLSSWKAAGFDGIESNDRRATPEAAAQARKVAERLGMEIHSVLYGWANFNKEDQFEADVASVAAALESCGAAGAEALLLVPCRIGGMAMPNPWEFVIEFNQSCGHVQKVVEGDNAPYADYIQAHNQAIDASRRAVEQLIPAAEKAGVVIALENVWNNLWVKPAIFANFIASFDSPSVQCYFDIGNHVKYAPPEEWIRTLGELIVRCHVKDFQLNPDGHGGRFVDIRDGSVDWPAVRKELDAIGYSGWMTIEGSGGLALEEKSERLELILAGK